MFRKMFRKVVEAGSQMQVAVFQNEVGIPGYINRIIFCKNCETILYTQQLLGTYYAVRTAEGLRT
jgi:RNase P subunit RPR2